MWFWLKNLYLSKQYGARKLLSEMNCPTRVGNFEASTVCWREATRRIQLSRFQAALDRICRLTVKDLVLSQEHKPIRHPSARNCHSLFKCIQENNSLWSPAHMLEMMCSAVVWSQSYFPSHSLINNVIVCNKSCYCSIINRKLYNE